MTSTGARARRASVRAAPSSACHRARGASRAWRCRVLAFAALYVLFTAVPAAADAHRAGSSRSYLLIAADERLPTGLEQGVQAIGGAMTLALPEIGVAAVRSGDSRFAARASALMLRFFSLGMIC